MADLIRKQWIVLFGFLLITMMGCDVFNSGEKGKGTLEVKMHDKPALYDAIHVQVEQVKVNVGEGWKPVMDSSQTVDLLKLVNGTFAELGSINLEAGDYQQIRLLLGRNNSITIDGETYDLKVPSAQQTGLKLNVDFSVESGAKTELLLDFDASRSIHKRGATQKYILRPVISARVRELTGDIEGTVEPAGSRPWVLAMNGSDTVSTTLADSASGNFELTGLAVDSYDVVIQPTDTTYTDTTITDVQVSAKETNNLGTIEVTKEN